MQSLFGCDTVSQLRAVVIFLISAVSTYLLITILTSSYPLNPLASMSPINVHPLMDENPAELEAIANSSLSIAIGLGISCRKMKINFKSPSNKDVLKQPFLRDLLPSFCATLTPSFSYAFYMAYDYNDPLLERMENIATFKYCFHKIVTEKCPANTQVNLVLHKVNYTKKPAWAQNDAMMLAYLHDHDYYYRLNDDTTLLSKNWCTKYINVLKKYSPHNIGVVGPSFKLGNTAILTYDFVHRTHVDIFGFYYPHIFEGWHADRWISDLYKPGRTTKIPDMWVKHLESLGQRYPSHKIGKTTVNSVVQDGKNVLNRYISQMSTISNITASASKVISFSLPDHSVVSLHGMLRNVILAKLYYPSWTVRLTTNTSLPEPYATKLRKYGLHLHYVDSHHRSLPSILWRHLVADDKTVEYFLVRDVRLRIGKREAELTDEWLRSGKAVHVVRDHPSVGEMLVDAKHWAGKTLSLRGVWKSNMADMLSEACSKSDCAAQETEIFKNMFSEKDCQSALFCHDSIKCANVEYVHNIEAKRENREYIGQSFNEFEIAKDHFPKDFSRAC